MAPLVPSLEFTTTPRKSIPPLCDSCLSRATLSYTPPTRSMPLFRALWLFVWNCSCRYFKYLTFKWAVPGGFCETQVPTDFDHWTTSSSRGSPLMRNRGRGIRRESLPVLYCGSKLMHPISTCSRTRQRANTSVLKLLVQHLFLM